MSTILLFGVLHCILLLGVSCSSEMNASRLDESGDTLLIRSSFEEPDELEEWESEQANNHAITRVNSLARAGKHSIKFSLGKNDPLVFGSYRAELKHSEIPIGAERWYGLSVFLPHSYIKDPIPESIFQWHNVPNFKKGENWSQYKFQNPFRIETNNGRFLFVHQFSTIPEDPDSPVATKTYDLGSYQTGVWTDWVVHFRLSYKLDGIFEIWKNGERVVNIKGPNYYNDESGPYFKMGIYKWGFPKSKVSNRTLYLDDIKIGTEKSSFEDVAPNSAN